MSTLLATLAPPERHVRGTSQRLSAPAPETRKHLREAMSLLLEAHEYATELGQDVWSFAVELGVLRGARLSHSDIRWLSIKGYIDHACETTGVDDDERRFRRTGPILFQDKTCFVCTDEGVAVARRLCGRTNEPSAVMPAPSVVRPAARAVEAPAVPYWDHQRRQIRVGEYVVKEFKLPAPNQETILTAFEEEGWPPRIDDPLPPVPDVDPRRRLHDTIKALNRKQRHQLMRFMGDGNGQGIRWELHRPAAATGESV